MLACVVPTGTPAAADAEGPMHKARRRGVLRDPLLRNPGFRSGIGSRCPQPTTSRGRCPWLLNVSAVLVPGRCPQARLPTLRGCQLGYLSGLLHAECAIMDLVDQMRELPG